jgi:hypothetical protein
MLAPGCGVSMMDIRPLAVSIPTGDPAVFEQLLSLSRSRGYAPTQLDGDHGTFVIDAQRRARPSELVHFTIQCHGDGFAEIIPMGPRVERRGGEFHLPSSVGEEYRDLVVAYREALHPGSGGLDR